MSDAPSNGQPSELVYVPSPSWYPALIAGGLAGILAGGWVWWPYAAVGALVALFALVAMIRDSRQEIERLPRQQRITTAPIPAETLKRDGD